MCLLSSASVHISFLKSRQRNQNGNRLWLSAHILYCHELKAKSTFPELTHQPGLPLGEAVAGPRVLKFEMGEITVEYFLFIDLKNNLQMSLMASILTKTTWE